MKLETESTPDSEAVRIRVWLVLAAGFGALVILIAFSGLTALQRATKSYAGISTLLGAERRAEHALVKLTSDMQESAIAVRDFLLEPETSAPGKRAELRKLQGATTNDLRELAPLILPEDQARFERMRHQIDEYWRTLDPLLTWTSAEDAERSLIFLKKEILPRRRAALELAAEIEALTANGVRERREEIDRRQAELPVYVERIVGVTILIGLLIAAVSVFRIYHLEQIAGRQHRKVVDAEKELRDLSRQLVRVQEEERRALSRELHDQIGQLLTAVRIGIGNIEEALGHCAAPVHHQIEQARRISEQALRSVRDLAMGLRPSMLDDLGLGAALQWQARQHSRLCGVPVSVNLDGDLEQLSDAQRTCIYRVVQEALNNVAKHAQASEIHVEVINRMGTVSIMVRDDGDGFDASGRVAKGLGLVGIKERVRQLGGQVTIGSQAGRGTSLWAIIPLELKEVAS